MENVNSDPQVNQPTAERPVGEIVKEIRSSVMDVVRAEIRLAKLELSTSLRGVKQNITKVAIGSTIALLGILPLMTFLIVGLGDLINNYWLSALIWTVVFLGVGTFLAYRGIKNMHLEQLTLPHSRHVFAEESEVIARRVKEMPTHLRRVV